MPTASKNLPTQRADLLRAALRLDAPWDDALVALAAENARVPAPRVALLFPEGAAGLVAFWHRESDAAFAKRAPAILKKTKRVRDKVAAAVLLRLQIDLPHRAAAKRAAALLALPAHWGEAAAQLYATSDAIWRVLKDASLDGNFYSKRVLLMGVYAATHLVWLDDVSHGQKATQDFLARRIADIMQFEKMKSQWRDWRGQSEAVLKSFAARRYARPKEKR